MSGGAVTVSEQVVREVANATGRGALELPPLYDVVDPDALDALVAGTSDGEVSFVYANQEVTVATDGTVTVDERDTVVSPADW